jgi:hypothetical protein
MVRESPPIPLYVMEELGKARWLMFAQDSILWTHILIQIAAWGIIFPTGMVLGVCSL